MVVVVGKVRDLGKWQTLEVVVGLERPWITGRCWNGGGHWKLERWLGRHRDLVT